MIKELKKLNNARFKLFLRMTALILLVAIYMAMPVYAWFYQGRSAIAVTLIDDPTSIHIDAANADEIRFLDLSSIDVEKEKDPTKRYTDRVFSVSGTGVDYYKLQLAYTTNNQFDYEIYPAVLLATDTNSDGVIDINDVPDTAVTSVEYTTHPSDSSIVQTTTKQVYYVTSGTAPYVGSVDNGTAAGAPLNQKIVGGEKLAYTHNNLIDDGAENNTLTNYHRLTYGAGADEYLNINKYAEPIYWQMRYSIPVTYAEDLFFVHYYVLRVKWNEDAHNDKETDIIYISAHSAAPDA